MTKHEYISKICEIVASKSSCEKSKVGAVIINIDYEILATGFNEAPSGMLHCDNKKTCLNENGKCIRTAHAEINAITQAAKNGTAINGAILYCTRRPCAECCKILINAKIKKVYCHEPSKFTTVFDEYIEILAI